MTTLVLLLLVTTIAVVDAQIRRIPESLCVGGVLFAFFWACMAPLDRFDLQFVDLPLPFIAVLWAVLIIFMQPGIVLDVRRSPRASLAVVGQSFRQRGALPVAVPLIVLGWLLLGGAFWFSPQRLQTIELVVLGAFIGLLALGLPHWIGRAVRGGGSIGSGDCLMLAMVGAFAGPRIVFVVSVLSILGLVVGSLVAWTVGRGVIPLGPVIAISTGLTLGFWSRFWPQLAVLFATPAVVAIVWCIAVSCLTMVAAIWLANRARSRTQPTRWILLAVCLLVAVGTTMATAAMSSRVPVGLVQSPLADRLTGGVEIAYGGGALSVRDASTGEVQLLAGSHSQQAMLQSQQRDIDWIEFGLVKTIDGKIVALRAWGEESKHWLGERWTGKPLTKPAFVQAARQRGWSPVDLEAIIRWLTSDDARHVLLDVDASEDQEIWSLVLERLDALAVPQSIRDRLLPMVDNPELAKKLSSGGLFRHVWTIRPEWSVTDHEMVSRCRRYGPVAVAAHYGRLRDSSLPEMLQRLGIPTIATNVRTLRQKTESRADAILTDLAGYPMR